MIPKLYVACAILGILIQFSKCFPASDQGGGGNCGGGGGNNGGIVSSITSDMYPTPRREECVSDKYAGNIIVKDPYRWMEKPVMEEIKKFYESHNAITRPYLDKSPFRPQIEARFKELNDHPKYYGPLKYGKKYYSFQNTGLQNQDVFYVQDSLNDEPKVFFDPNALSEDGTIALNFDTSSFSYDGLIFAYSLSQNGSDRMKVKFKHVEKGDIYKEELIEVRYTTLQWTRNNKGIFYGRFLGDNPDHESVLNQKLYYHEVGTDQSKDVLVAEFPKNPDYMIGGVNLSDCGKYLIITPSDNDDHNLIYIADLEKINYEIKGKLDLIPIVTKMEAIYEFIANDDTIFTFRTNKDADNYVQINNNRH
ncbi:prolyl endopeptidase-like [Planococcus citri]|uniref:prolyl endopeptidase-like n=1 Tax=Planococcus citri TaxID=170843 RepID=UPI0031F77025